MSDDRIDPATAVEELLDTRYRGATAIFLAGSGGRGGATAHSDLDLVVVVERAQPVREAYVHHGWPVDASVSDQAALLHAMAQAPQRGECTLATLVVDSVVMPGPSAQTDALRQRARAIIDAGPAPLSDREHQLSRFSITYLRSKLLGPRLDEDIMSLGAMLHVKLCHFHLRANRRWSGTPTSLGRVLREADPALARQLFEAFHALFSRFDCAPVIDLTEAILAPHGGLLFDGFSEVHNPAQPARRPRPLG